MQSALVTRRVSLEVEVPGLFTVERLAASSTDFGTCCTVCSRFAGLFALLCTPESLGALSWSSPHPLQLYLFVVR